MLQLLFLFAFLSAACSQNCAPRWTPHNGSCWYFSDKATDHPISMTWTEAESWCLQHDARLASFASVEERDWTYDSYLSKSEQTRWWIGATDALEEKVFKWSDGSDIQPDVPRWKIDEPSNSGKEDCVELWVEGRLYDGQWNDNNCDTVDPFICKGATGSFQEACPVGWKEIGENCYKIINNEEQWHYANVDCKSQGAQLVSVTSTEEQAAVQELISPQNQDFWLGLSDEATPGTLQWSDPGSVGSSYVNWAQGQPSDPLPYLGSTCVAFSSGNNYQWTTMKCSAELKYLCKRGLKGRCPPGWLLLAGKCYELIINDNRLQTWPTAKQVCDVQGARLIRIETEQQHQYVGTVLQQFGNLGFHEIWLGGSDIGHDQEFRWSDKSPIDPDVTYWAAGQPQSGSLEGREDCMSLYTGSTQNNWEASSCFYERPFICELPEGATLPNVPPITVEGKCESGWRHFKPYCYYFGEKDVNQAEANNFCTSNQAQLVDILSANEQSFVVGHIQSSSWIGLHNSGGSYKWKDGSTPDFLNWASGSPSAQKNQCVYMLDNGEWEDSLCSSINNYVCKKDEIPTPESTISPPTGDPSDIEKCGGDGWFSNPSSNRCYFINALQVRSWDDARYTCQKMGGDLASINSPDEQAFIHLSTANLPTVSNLWIGAIDPNRYSADIIDITDGGWKWSDGSPFNYLNWNTGEPNNSGDEDCTEMMVSSGFWNDISCDSYFHYICEKAGKGGTEIGADISDPNCRSNEACCFKHIGVEYGGRLDDSVLSASSERNEYYTADRGRLNSPANVIVITDGIAVGTGHGAWIPKSSEENPWLQVDLQGHMEIKGIVTQGRNGIVQYTERQWTTTFKISYSQDSINTGSDVKEWEFLSDDAGEHLVFNGNNDQNTQVTNLFPRPIIARHIRCHPITWKDRAALRLEYIGCYASCLNKLGMNSGLISDKMIAASSSGSGKSPIDARPDPDPVECLASAQDLGGGYRGWISKTVTGNTCQKWSEQYPQEHDRTPENYPDAGLVSNFCRNPDGEPRPWCYTTNPSVRWELCNVPICPTYPPKGWSPSVNNVNQYVEVQFEDFYKVSGVTLYGSSSVYVTKYILWFSDDGTNYMTYKTQTGQDKLFKGLESGVTHYTDILREPITTKYVRVQPKEWNGGQIILQFEVHGCYVDRRITCSEIGSDFEEDQLTINCPSGCVEDTSAGTVYGTTVYTENSAVCPAAVHAGRVSNNHGGTVDFMKTPGINQYLGTYANGIQSLGATDAHLSLEFDGSVFRCADGWRPWKDHCYYLSLKEVFKNWQDARADCISMGGDLASIQSSGENDFIEYQIQGGGRGRDVWIGLSDLRTFNYYQWSDDSVVTYTKWDTNEPNGGDEGCVHIYRVTGRWNDRNCAYETSYMCKKEKEKLPPLDEEPADEGCDPGWTGYGSSCYRVSTDEKIFIYANRICEESDAKLSSIHDDQENAFLHALVTDALPPGLGYTSWIGMAARNTPTGELYYEWESGEPVSYTHWMEGEPEVRFSCAFPFEYKGTLYYECITFDHPIRRDDTAWCSIDPIFNNRWINCEAGFDEYGCAFMDDNTGFWGIDLCLDDRYYVCEKDRFGYTQPGYTTLPTTGSCADGWDSDATTTHCYQINEFSFDDISKRLSWHDALDYCQAQGADLVSIHSTEEADAIARFVLKGEVYSYTYFWLGLNILDDDAGYVWSDGSSVSYTLWAPGEPNDHNGQEKCVEGQLYDSYSGWNDITCDSLRNYICKIAKGKDPNPPPTVPPPEGNENDPQCGTDPEGMWVSYQPSYGTFKCYMFMTNPTYGWQFAENDCMTRNGHLVSIHSDDENKFLAGRIALTGIGDAWIGLRDVGERSFYWADGSFLDYQYWAPGEPNNYYDSEGCVTLHVDGATWNDDNCGRLFGYVCEKVPGSNVNTPPPTTQSPGNCPSGFTSYGNKCYITGGETKDTWENARQWCKDNGADLVSITNGYEQSFINNYLFGTGETYWTGLSDRFTSSGQFVWIDEVELSFTNWAPGEPSGYAEGCAVLDMNNDGWWFDNDCSAINSFLCYAPKSVDIGAPPMTENPLGCPSGFYASTHEEACYQLVDEPKTWEDARQYCRNQGDAIELVSIHEMYDNDLLKSWFWHDVTSGDALWLGMTFTAAAGEASSAKFQWTDGWPVLYTNWGPDEPNDDSINTGDGCVLMNKDGSWAAVPVTGGGSNCGTAMPFVCKKSFEPIPTTPEEPVGTCDPGFIALGSYCYFMEYGLLEAGRRSWFEAAVMCEQRGANLASFHSDEEVESLVDILSVSTTSALFIGLSSNGFNGWTWKDGAPAEYFNWGENEPNGEGDEECVEMYPSDGKWNDVNCFDKKGYICKTSRGNTKCNVESDRRIDCGKDYEGIDEDYCVQRRGCCWDELFTGGNNSGCFYDEDYTNAVLPTEEPIGPEESGGLSSGALAGIIIGVLAVIFAIVMVVYCKYFSESKSLSMPSMPTSWTSSSTKSPTKDTEAAGGFDNPMALSDDGNFHAVA